MRLIRLFVLAIASFVVALISSFLTPGKFLNRTIAMLTCTIFSFNSTVCNVNWAKLGDRSMATSPPVLSQSVVKIDSVLLSQRSREFDDETTNSTPTNNPSVPAYPQQVSPSTPLREDFSNSQTMQQIFDELHNDPVLARTLGDMPLELCQMAQVVIDKNRQAMEEFAPPYTPPEKNDGQVLLEKAADLTHLNKVNDLLEAMKKMSKKEGLEEFFDKKIKETFKAELENALKNSIKTDLNCSKFAYDSEEEIDSCELCTYQVKYRYPKLSGENAGTFSASCNGSLRQKIGRINTQLARDNAKLSLGYGVPVVAGIPELLNKPDKFCKNRQIPAAIQAAAESASNEVLTKRACKVPKDFFTNRRVIVGVRMDDYVCVIDGPVMTNQGAVDGVNECGTCDIWGNFGLPPQKSSCDSRAIDPGRSNPVSKCPSDWDGSK